MANISRFLLTNAIINVSNAIEQVSAKSNYNNVAVVQLSRINEELREIRDKYLNKNYFERKEEKKV